MPHPVKYAYDSTYGQRTEISSYRGDPNDPNEAWSDDSWPTAADDPDTITLTYDAATGLMTDRENAEEESAEYTYTSDGKLNVRTWVRSGPITTTYTYYNDPNGTDFSGMLKKIEYSDPNVTPTVEYEYTRVGKLDEVTDALGTRTFAYDSYGLPASETFDASSILSGKVITTDYEYRITVKKGMLQQNFDLAGLAGIEVGTSGEPSDDYDIAYTYDGDGRRIEKVTGVGLPSAGANYTYASDSGLVEKIEFKTALGVKASINYAYHDHADLPTAVSNIYGNDPTDPNMLVSKYSYAYDELWRAKWKVCEGHSDFDAFASDRHDKFTYDDHNRLLTSKRYNTTDPNQSTNPDWPFDRRLWYDNAGNNKKYWSPDPNMSDPNLACSVTALNQRDAIYGGEDPGSDPVIVDYQYDDDGNPTLSGWYNQEFDAENRLIVMEPNSPFTGVRRHEMTYDYLGRVVRREITVWDDGQWDASHDKAEDRRYVYLDRKVLVQYARDLNGDEDDNIVVRQLAWGPNPNPSSGRGNRGWRPTMPGGTNVTLGTNLAMREPGEPANNYLMFYDGAGHAGQWVDQSDGSVPVAYEYDNTQWTRYDILCPNDRPRRIEDCICDPCLDKYGDGSGVLLWVTPDGRCTCHFGGGDPGGGLPPTPGAGPCAGGGNPCSPACIGPLPFGVDVFQDGEACGDGGTNTIPGPEWCEDRYGKCPSGWTVRYRQFPPHYEAPVSCECGGKVFGPGLGRGGGLWPECCTAVFGGCILRGRSPSDCKGLYNQCMDSESNPCHAGGIIDPWCFFVRHSQGCKKKVPKTCFLPIFGKCDDPFWKKRLRPCSTRPTQGGPLADCLTACGAYIRTGHCQKHCAPGDCSHDSCSQICGRTSFPPRRPRW